MIWKILFVAIVLIAVFLKRLRSPTIQENLDYDSLFSDEPSPLITKIVPNKFSFRNGRKIGKIKLPPIPQWSLALAQLSRSTDVAPYHLRQSRRTITKTKKCLIIGHPSLPIDLFVDRLSPDIVTSDLSYTTLYQKCRPYRFTIIFNSLTHLVISLVANCIPIYLGTPESLGPFFSDRIIVFQNFASQELCLNRILNFPELLNIPACSQEHLNQAVGWYYKHPSFFETIYRQHPTLRCPNFQPFRKHNANPKCPIKVINLDHSKDRWIQMSAQFQKKPKLQYERFPAIDGNTLDFKSIPINNFKYKVNYFPNFKPGELGIYLSNMELFHLLVHDDENEFYLILEDDVDISNLDPLETYNNEAPTNWDILFLGANQHYCKQPSPTKKTTYIPMEYACMPGNFAFMIRKRAAQFYLNFGLPLEVPIDQFQRMCAKNLNIYIRIPNVVTTEYFNQSTIETERNVQK